ncbi:hypothetical protein ACHAWF_010239 [Thalassiosira exigua]
MPFWKRRSETDSSTPTEVDFTRDNDLAHFPTSTGTSSEVLSHGGAAIQPGPSSTSITPSNSSNPQELPQTATGEMEASESLPWTRIFPEAYGIRQSIEDSSFRFCVKESIMWGIATGTMMGMHRLRMHSRPSFAINVAFGTALIVTAPSYYFCFRRREHQERVIETMMAVNDFRPGEEMPETVPLNEDHPFLTVKDKESDGNDGDLQKEFVARLKEKKEWQEPHQTKDVGDVFKEVERRD